MIAGHRPMSLKWSLATEPDHELVVSLAAQTELPNQIVRILINRGLETSEKINQFLNRSA